jgi:hypothetical protein
VLDGRPVVAPRITRRLLDRFAGESAPSYGHDERPGLAAGVPSPPTKLDAPGRVGTRGGVSASSRLVALHVRVVTTSAPAVSATYKRVYFSNRFGRLLALDSRTGAEVWRTSALGNPGDKAQDTPPRVLLVKDAIVTTAGDTPFSRSPDGPT